MKKSFGYVNTFVVPVPRKNLAKYKKMMKLFAKAWVKHGALEYCECVGDKLEEGDVTSFPKSVKLKKGEVVIFAWATFKTKAQRDRAMAKVMSDPLLAPYMDPDKMPFDGMRMFWGGFKPIVKA
jgi:uncharacterized protein YbaA (DUF1428 family)